MRISLPARVAWRYLWSKKSHSAVSTISAVSICGVAVAAAAIICVLSVFNGFKAVIAERLDMLTPDVIVTPAKGKVFENGEELAGRINRIDGVEIATPTLTDNALAIYETREIPVLMKGVYRDQYEKVTPLGSLRIDTICTVEKNSGVLLSVGAASRLGAVSGEELLLFTPRREGRVNPANPAASFLTDSIAIEGIFRTEQEDYDANLIVTDITSARELLQYDSEASAIEIKAKKNTDPEILAKRIAENIGNESFVVKDRFRQQEMNFRMISIEKWVSFLLLFFILVIASFNIISSLSMLVIDKQHNLSTFIALGFTRKDTGAIFWWESIYVALAGGISGIILGASLSLLQQHFGIIKINDNMPDPIAYPVVLEPGDILVTMLPVIAIALVTAFITAAFASNRTQMGMKNV